MMVEEKQKGAYFAPPLGKIGLNKKITFIGNQFRNDAETYCISGFDPMVLI